MKNSVAVYCSDLSAKEDIIKKIRLQYKNSDDFLIFTDIPYSTEGCDDYGIMSTFYMKFFPGKIIFLNNDDYYKYSQNILGDSHLYEENNI